MDQMAIDTSLTLERKPAVERTRRNSTGNVLLPKTDRKVILSRYLRASIGSCHDLCKNGTKQDIETQPSSPMHRKTGTTHIKSSVRNAESYPLKKKLSPNPKPSSIAMNQAFSGKKSATQKEVSTSAKQVFISLQKVSSSSAATNASIPSPRTPKLIRSGSSPVSDSSKHSTNSLLGSKSCKVRNTDKSSRLNNLKSAEERERKQDVDDNISERTLHVIVSRDESQTSEIGEKCSTNHFSTPSPDIISLKEVQNEAYETRPSSASELTNEEEVNSRSEFKASSEARGSESVTSESSECSLERLKFKSGKVTDVWSNESSPCRLSFKSRELLSRLSNDKVEQRRCLRRTMTDVGTYRTAVEAVNVNLRHQSTDRKSSHQRLFNNVIEEAARKLELTRKSKVKALVGAFESVISLQDGN